MPLRFGLPLANLFFLCLLTCLPANAQQPLAIVNHTSSDILNIHATNERVKFFIRLDLAPGARDDIENPRDVVDMRVDTGLALWFFDDVNLGEAQSLIFTPDAVLEIVGKSGATARLVGKISNLVTAGGDRTVCELGKFRPRMPMREVCDILDPNAPVDDSGGVLAPIGFAGLPWAGRFVASTPDDQDGDSLLQHMELRRPLSREDVRLVLKHLADLGFVPWQAEFPGKDIDFTQTTANSGQWEQKLVQRVDEFLHSRQAIPLSGGKPNPGDEEVEAKIMLAPASSIKRLATADDPTSDAQLYTLILKPQSRTLVLDVAAYAATGQAKP